MMEFRMPGVTTALVTPFNEDGTVNYEMFSRLLDRQIQAGIRSLVICGTTGEAPTLTDSEKQKLFQKAKAQAGPEIRILAGTGSNCTAHAVTLSRMAEKAGADGLLVVSPYYNKANSQGLIRHYTTVAEAVSVPVILYNVPSRTGLDISPEVCAALSALPNIAGIKEANPDLKKAEQILACCRDGFQLWSGNDDLILPMISIGAQGVISVLSNVCPRTAAALTDAALRGDFVESRRLFYPLLPLIRELFIDPNPIPVKAAMDILGYPCGGCRLPLTRLSKEKRSRMEALLSDLETE